MRIERSYQRAMNIRDSTPAGASTETETRQNEEWYTKMYRKCYWNAASLNKTPPFTFSRATRLYLKTLRRLARVR